MNTKVTKSESRPGYYRLIIDVNENYSVGTIIKKGELRQLMNDIRTLLDSTENDLEGSSDSDE